MAWGFHGGDLCAKSWNVSGRAIRRESDSCVWLARFDWPVTSQPGRVFQRKDHLPHLSVLAERYRDRSPDLADLCLIRMSELYPHHTVITVDCEDFQTYRRNKREVIPVCTPAGQNSR